MKILKSSLFKTQEEINKFLELSKEQQIEQEFLYLARLKERKAEKEMDDARNEMLKLFKFLCLDITLAFSLFLLALLILK